MSDNVEYYRQFAAEFFLHHAQSRRALATAGPGARIRHSQYGAFVMIPLGFLLQWPTLLTLTMFPIRAAICARLAVTEKAVMRRSFGAVFEVCASHTPRFVPALRTRTSGA